MRIRFHSKLLAGFGLIGLIMAFITSLAMKTIHDTSALLSRTIETQVRQLATANGLQFQAHKIRLQEAELSKITDIFATTGAIQQLQKETDAFTGALEGFVTDVALENEVGGQHLFEQWQSYVHDQKLTIRAVRDLQFDEAQKISTYYSRPRFQDFSQNLKKLSARIEKQARLENRTAQASLADKHRFFLMWSLGGMSLALIFALLLSHSLSTRLRVLRRGALALAQGRLKQPIAVAGNDEVTDLADTFKRMHVQVQSREDELRRAHDELEERVRERTRELRCSNELLSEKTILLQSILDAIPAPIYYKAADGVFTGCNRAFENVLGRSRDAIISSTAQEVASAELTEPFHTADLELMQKGGTQVYEASVPYADGSRHEVIFNKAAIRNGEGKVIGLVGAMLDITERKKAEEALEKSEREYRELSQQFEALLDGISDALVLFSPQLEVVWANRGAARLFGYRHDELEGMPCKNFWCKSNTQCRECITNCFASGMPLEMIERTTDGRCWGIKLFPIKGAEGRIENVIQIISDVTEKIRLREQATQASRLASLGELAAGVAHEINNPNAQILLNLPIVREAIEDSLPMLEERFGQQGDFPWGGLEFSRMRREVPDLVSEMQDASARIRNIVEDLKHFSRHERSDNMRCVDLNKAVATAVRLTRNTIKRSTGRFEVEYDDRLPAVNGIAQRLEQVIVNLIINATQALPERTSGIRVRTCYDPENERCRVQVSDEGVGIGANILAHITDPFFTTRRETGGTGLGLSIATRIVKEHGGDMLFDSSPGRGTTVTIELPAAN